MYVYLCELMDTLCVWGVGWGYAGQEVSNPLELELAGRELPGRLGPECRE